MDLYKPIQQVERNGLKLDNSNDDNENAKAKPNDMNIEECKTLTEFDLKELPEYFSLLLIGSRRSGKSFILDWILNQVHEQHKWDEVYLFSATSRCQREYFKYNLDADHKIETLETAKINEIYQRRLDMLEKYRDNPEAYPQAPNALLIFDDLLSDRAGHSIFYNREVNRLFFAGRQLASVNFKRIC